MSTPESNNVFIHMEAMGPTTCNYKLDRLHIDKLLVHAMCEIPISVKYFQDVGITVSAILETHMHIIRVSIVREFSKICAHEVLRVLHFTAFIVACYHASCLAPFSDLAARIAMQCRKQCISATEQFQRNSHKLFDLRCLLST